MLVEQTLTKGWHFKTSLKPPLPTYGFCFTRSGLRGSGDSQGGWMVWSHAGVRFGEDFCWMHPLFGLTRFVLENLEVRNLHRALESWIKMEQEKKDHSWIGGILNLYNMKPSFLHVFWKPAKSKPKIPTKNLFLDDEIERHFFQRDLYGVGCIQQLLL